MEITLIKQEPEERWESHSATQASGLALVASQRTLVSRR